MKKYLPIVLSFILTVQVACSSFTELGASDRGSEDAPIAMNPTATAGVTHTPEPLDKVLPITTATSKTTRFPDAPDRDLFRLTKELIPRSEDISRIISGETTEYEVGRTDTFWLVNLAKPQTYRSEFELVLVTPHAYWYVENGLDFSLQDIKNSANVFEKDIYPVLTEVFGSEWTPGIDNDPHLNILNASLVGVAGYYSSTDEYPTSVRPKSNQREIIYINAHNVPPGSADYNQTLAHELQHAIHWYADASEDTWINEGLSELSTSIALHSSLSIRQFLRAPPTSLINWPTSSVGSISNYGASSLFMHYLSEHYGGLDGLKSLVAQPKDSIAGVDAYLESIGYEVEFEDVFRQWTVANILDGDGLLGYEALTIEANVGRKIRGFNQIDSAIPQYAVEYTELHLTTGPFTLSFMGPTTTPLLPIDIGNSGCWWGNSGDSIDSTLTHQVALPAESTPTLNYDIWFEIEEDWDYLYVEVSTDRGQTWRLMETHATSTENPMGNSFGPGYTGNSNGWVQENIDLSPYAGEIIWVRFQYLTDDAVNPIGACIRNLSITSAEIGIDDADWEANGFAFTNNMVEQRFQVQIITTGKQANVQQITLDENNSGTITLNPPKEEQRLIIAVAALAEKTREKAGYTLTVSQAE